MRPRFANLIIAVLIAGVAVGVAFGGGILYGRNTAPTPKTASAAPSTGGGAAATGAGGGGAAAAAGGGGAAGARAAGTPGAGGRGGGGQGAAGLGGLIGAISRISGNTIDVTTTQGTVVPVQIAPDTRIQLATEGSVSDLKPGLIVSVTGQADGTGTVPASAIQILPLGPGQPGPGQPGATPRPGGQGGQSGQGNRGGQGGRPTPTPTPTP